MAHGPAKLRMLINDADAYNQADDAAKRGWSYPLAAFASKVPQYRADKASGELRQVGKVHFFGRQEDDE
jgi:hypothetical protein